MRRHLIRLASAPPVADPELANEGAKVERRRREYRGAEGVEGVGCGEGVSPSPPGVPPPQNFFD